MDMATALTRLEAFRAGGTTSRINALAVALADACGEDCERRLQAIGAQDDMLHAALVVKQASSQIDTILHALGMALALPRILGADERVLHLSLGAGTNDGRFDLETDRRIAEFKFIQWRGRDAQRQIGLFKDFYDLAEFDTAKARYLYVLNKPRVVGFLSGRSKIGRLLSKASFEERFTKRFGDRYMNVGQYFNDRQERVTIVNLAEVLDHFKV